LNITCDEIVVPGSPFKINVLPSVTQKPPASPTAAMISLLQQDTPPTSSPSPPGQTSEKEASPSPAVVASSATRTDEVATPKAEEISLSPETTTAAQSSSSESAQSESTAVAKRDSKQTKSKVVYAVRYDTRTSTVIGAPFQFELYCRDLDGKDLPLVGCLYVDIDGPKIVKAKCKEHPERPGTFLAEFQAVAAGQYNVKVTVDRQLFAGCPFHVTVVESTTDGSNRSYEVSGAGLQQASVGKATSFELHSKDATGAFAPAVGRIDVEFDGPRAVYSNVKEAAKVGQYTVEYTVTAAGKYQLSINVGGKHVTNSPFSVTVT